MKTNLFCLLISFVLVAILVCSCMLPGFATEPQSSQTTVTEEIISTATAKEIEDIMYARPQTAGTLLALLKEGAALKRENGNDVKSDDLIATGMRLIKADGTQLTVIIKGDINADGKITASDARAALRFAVYLDIPDKWQKNAAKIFFSPMEAAEDARMILRAAVGLDGLPLYSPIMYDGY